MRRCENPAEKPICTCGTLHPPFLPRRGVLTFPFPPNLYLLVGTGAELGREYTQYTADGELQLPRGPHTQIDGPWSDPGHRLLQVTPQGALRTPLSGLLSAPPAVVVLHSFLQLHISSDVFSLYRRVKAWSRT